MRIGLVCPVWFPVPPEAYGGTERVVALLADGLVDAGHDVTLFASGDSQTRARLESVFHTAPSEWIGHTYWEMQHSVHAFRKADEFDVLHDHTGMLGLAFGGLVDTPFCHTVHGPLDGQPGRMYEQVRRARAVREAHLHLDEPAQAEAGPPLDRELPERARPLDVPVPAQARRRLPRLPRSHEPRQGCAPRARRGTRDRDPAEDRREVPRAARDPLLRRVHPPAPRRLDRVRRRGRATRTRSSCSWKRGR